MCTSARIPLRLPHFVRTHTHTRTRGDDDSRRSEQRLFSCLAEVRGLIFNHTTCARAHTHLRERMFGILSVVYISRIVVAGLLLVCVCERVCVLFCLMCAACVVNWLVLRVKRDRVCDTSQA